MRICLSLLSHSLYNLKTQLKYEFWNSLVAVFLHSPAGTMFPDPNSLPHRSQSQCVFFPYKMFNLLH